MIDIVLTITKIFRVPATSEYEVDKNLRNRLKVVFKESLITICEHQTRILFWVKNQYKDVL